MKKKDEEELPNMTRELLNKGCDPLYKDAFEVAATLLVAGWSKGTVLRNLEAVRRMATIRFENERRKRLERIRRVTC